MGGSILGLDLGSTTGWAVWNNGNIHSGIWVLATQRELALQRCYRGDRNLDLRFARLLHHLREAVSQHAIEAISFEDIQFQSSRAQTQLWASLRAAVWAVASDRGLAVACVATGTLKKFATGRGDATKEAMAAALAALRPPWARETLSHDEIDALWVLRWALRCRDSAPAGIVPVAAGTR